MNEEIIEEFNEKFKSVEEALKYIADSQAKSEFIRKQENTEFSKRMEEMREMQERTQRQLDHITKDLRFSVEELEFQEGKLEEAGIALSRKREK